MSDNNGSTGGRGTGVWVAATAGEPGGFPCSGGGGSGQAGYGNWTEASVIQNGILYSPEQWHRKQMSERLAAVEAKLDRALKLLEDAERRRLTGMWGGPL